MKKLKTKDIAVLGMLAALAVVLSYLESLLPQFPFMPPGSKAGLSNIATVYTAFCYNLPFAIIISIIKSLFVFLTRGFYAFLLSLTGGICSIIVMYLLYKFCSKISFIGIGIAGALTHNATQLVAAMLITQTKELVYYSPVLLIFALISGFVTGMILKYTVPYLLKITNKISERKKDD